MARTGLTKPQELAVNRSELRQNQRALLKRARGRTVILLKSEDKEEEKVIVDKQYFDLLQRRVDNLIETLEITMDRKLFNQILATADSLEEDVRQGKLHSLEEAFPED